ncbi:hypothetical protein QA659_04315 [Proteus mirabilis]|uniref:hypothetical protein n=1 Tax=Proteus mirabilis TaxID=584 RepID=UPI001A1AF198|nr:hypothetical protein [Proteus mirabilis]MBI6506936.1 hypothetical protein [Proteus mirabilis]MDL4004224.1 hypothetical protein [Proteus mirabilis]
MDNKEDGKLCDEYEKTLRRNLKLLFEQINAGKVHIRDGLQIKDSLLAVRKGADGEIDLSTVDGLVRSMASAIAQMNDREELKKKISLSDIQNNYFSFIEQQFGEYYKIMLENKGTPHDIGKACSKDNNIVNDINKNLKEFLNLIVEYWKQVGEIAHMHISDMKNNIKGVFGGDLFPSHAENIASKCGVYTDTIILPDPFLRSKHIFEYQSKKDKVYYLFKHAMNILKYKDLACANVDIPIVVIIPDFAELQENEKEFFHSLGKQDSIIHAGKLFGRNFESFDELIDFAKTLDTVDKALTEVKDSSRILFDVEWTGDIKAQLERALKHKVYSHFAESPGILLASQSLGRMSVSNELLIKSRRLNATPIIDAPTSWQYLVWKLEYDANRAELEFKSENLHITRGLNNLAKDEMVWLGNIPPKALIELREKGIMDDIRNILGAGINEIIEAEPLNFSASKEKILLNIEMAFKQHQENIKILRKKKWKFAGKDIGSCLVFGAIGITAAVTGTPTWGLAAYAAGQFLDATKLKDIPKSIRTLIDENNDVKKSPVGILFDIHKKISN